MNRTGLQGRFTIDIEVAPQTYRRQTPSALGKPVISADAQNEAPALRDALRDQMGLAVSTEREAVRLFVVERLGTLVPN